MRDDFLLGYFSFRSKFPLCRVKGEEKMSIGKGFAASHDVNYPVIILPGFASSGLECEAGFLPWVHNRVW